MLSDDLQIMQALMGPQENLSKEDGDALLEFLVQVRSGQELTGTQRKRLHEIAASVGAGSTKTG